MTSIASARVARFGWITVAINLAVIVWGAFVRATGSGAGCGNHWPLCNGTVVPRAPATETLIELTHRVTSGLALLAVCWLVFIAVRDFPRFHRVRIAAWVSFALIIFEALLGAGLVKFELVADNASVARSVTLAAHLVNTQFMIAAMALTAWWAGGRPAVRLGAVGGKVGWLLVVGLALMLVAITGVVASLGNTLFPAETLRDGILQDLDPASHILLRLRVLHPFLAVGTGLLAMFVATRAIHWRELGESVTVPARIVGLFVVAQWVLGAATLLMLAPIPMQLVHLLTADLLWMAWILFGASVLADQSELFTRTSDAMAAADSRSNTDPAPSSR